MSSCNYPWSNAVGHPLRMCSVVGKEEPQTDILGPLSPSIFFQIKWVSDPARRMKDS